MTALAAAGALAQDANPTQAALEKSTSALRDVGAGAELFVLAQNFLLYIALVIMTAMLQHYYFPDSILRGMKKAEQPPDKAGEVDAQADVELVNLVDADALEDAADAADAPPPKAPSPKSPPPKRAAGFGALVSIVEIRQWRQEQASKNEVLTRLAVCCVGLVASFLVCGVLQERLLTKPYGLGEDYFTSSYGLVFMNRVGGFVISGAMLYSFAPPSSDAIAYRFAFPSVSNMLSSWCQYEALKYVSFPTQMLFKCFKLFPIMLMGKILGTKSYPASDYAVALCVGVGIAIFAVSTEDLNVGQDSIGEVETLGGTICGFVLLFFFLVFDSFTGQYQGRMFNDHPELSPYHMMFMVNTFSMIFSFITLIHTNELSAACSFVYTHPEMHIHLIVFSLASTIGQLFIFKTIKSFGPIIFAICMNTRIILSILLSSFIYSHELTLQGMFGLFIVFAAMAYRIKRKTENQQLIKWRGDDKSMDVFHEWHEHCDM